MFSLFDVRDCRGSLFDLGCEVAGRSQWRNYIQIRRAGKFMPFYFKSELMLGAFEVEELVAVLPNKK